MATRIYVPKTPEEHFFFATWLKARIDHFEPRNVQTVALYKDDKIATVVGFANPHYNRVEMSWASDDPKWVTRGNILSLMAPVFMGTGNGGITAVVLRGNKRVRKFIEGIGFQNEGTIRRAGVKGENLIIYGLLRDEYMELCKKYRPRLPEGVLKEAINGRR